MSIGVIATGINSTLGDEQGMILPSSNRFDVIQFYLSGKVTIFTLSATELAIDSVTKSYAEAIVLYSIESTSPLPLSASTRVWLVPQETSCTNPEMPSIFIGFDRFLVFPWPSWPSMPLPQEYSYPFDIAHIWNGPQSIFVTSFSP